MVDELYRSVDTVQLTGILPGVFRLDISEGDLTAVVPVDQSLLVIDLDGPRRQKSHSVLPGDHILAWPETVVNQGPGRAMQPLPLLLTRQGKVTSSPTLISNLSRADWKCGLRCSVVKRIVLRLSSVLTLPAGRRGVLYIIIVRN